MPGAALAHQYLARLGVMASPGALEQTGEALGTSPGGSQINLGPFGVRVPFVNAAARQGMSREWEIMKMRQAGGINGQQARFIFDQLNAKGFQPDADQKYSPFEQGGGITGDQLGGLPMNNSWLDKMRLSLPPGDAMRQTPRFEDMANAAKKMTQKNPELVNEEYFTLMDKATRAGAMSLASFNKNMAEVATVAKSTGYSFQQLQVDMDAVGQVNEQQGGTHAAGQIDAVRFQAQTKLPAALMPGLMQNPFVQTYAMRMNGLMPWEQGLETGAQRSADISGAVSQVYNSVGPGLPNQTEHIAGGFTRTISANDRRLALVHTMFPELSVDKLKQLVETHKTVQARSTLEDMTQAWSQTVGRTHDPKALAGLMDPKRMKGGWGAVEHQMDLAGFTKADKAAVDQSGHIDIMDKQVQKMLKDGKTPDQIMATRRYKEIQKIIDQKGDKIRSEQNPKLTIELGNSAKKFGFFIENKNKARAGQTSVNIPFGTGPSQIGTP
jgi:hypothetical protein